MNSITLCARYKLSFKSLNFQSINFLNNQIRLNSTKNGGDDKNVKEIYPTEDRPPLPPYQGYLPNDYTRVYERMDKVRSKFKYGVAPRMKRQDIKGPLVIRLQRISPCSNRPFYRFAVIHNNFETHQAFNEDVGSYDPMPNRDNEVIVALNLDRIRFHMGKGVPIKGTARELLGLSGFLPVYPKNYMEAWKNRRKLEQVQKEKEKKAETSLNNQENKDAANTQEAQA